MESLIKPKIFFWLSAMGKPSGWDKEKDIQNSAVTTFENYLNYVLDIFPKLLFGAVLKYQIVNGFY